MIHLTGSPNVMVRQLDSHCCRILHSTTVSLHASWSIEFRDGTLSHGPRQGLVGWSHEYVELELHGKKEYPNQICEQETFPTVKQA